MLSGSFLLYVFYNSLGDGDFKAEDYPNIPKEKMHRLNALHWRDWLFNSNYQEQFVEFHEKYCKKFNLSDFWNGIGSVSRKKGI